MKEKFEYGDIVEVRDRTDENWYKGKFLILDEGPCPYVVRCKNATCACGYKFCRKVRPDLKIDDPVWVRDLKAARWLPRHFAGWSDDGSMQAFADGTTSHTHRTGVSTWKLYSLKPEEASS